MAYHKKVILKGKIGEFSKIIEEIEELKDAYEQEDKILLLCELTDLIGAIDLYVSNKFNLTINDLINFSNKTKESFIEGKRKC